MALRTQLETASLLQTLKDRIESRSASVGVIGLGYVGLPVAVTFAEAGFEVVGVDFDQSRIDAINRGESYLEDIDSDRLAEVVDRGHLRAATEYKPLRSADALLICVPTPLADAAPDLSKIESCGRALERILKPGAVVVLESTTYPGTTEELLQPLLEVGGMVAGRDFFLAYSPERIDPANPIYGFGDIPKVVGGVTAESTTAAALVYGQVLPKVFTVSGTREAELAKLIENTFRHVNIALVNELAIYAHELGIDIWEAIEAAATKPFGFLPFWPSPGWGGHCIPLDPSYLSWRVRKHRSHEVRFVELAQTMNSEMPRYVVERVATQLNESEKPVKGSKILCVGVAYKAGISDTREAPAQKIMLSLFERGAELSYHDPLVPVLEINGLQLKSTALTPQVLSEQDLVLVLIPQEGVDWGLIQEEASAVFDCCSALGKSGEHIHRL